MFYIRFFRPHFFRYLLLLSTQVFIRLERYCLFAEAYRRAVDLNPRDYRAWYGLGQTYELLHMPFYALNYFRRATQVSRAATPLTHRVGHLDTKLGGRGSGL